MPEINEAIIKVDTYLKYVRKKRLQRYLLVVTKDYIRSLPDILVMAHRLKKRVDKVFVVAPEKSRVADFLTGKKIEYIEEGSREYLRLLAVSRYIYSNVLMPDQFIKREGQTICLDYALENRSFGEDYLEYASCVNTLVDCSDITSFVKVIRGEKSESKKNLLIILDADGYDKHWDDIKRALKLYSGKTRELYLLPTNSMLEKGLEELENLGTDVHLIIRRNLWLLDRRTKKEFNRMKTSLSKAAIGIKDEQDAISDRVIDRMELETKRIFGDLEFSEILNFCKGTIYWDFISVLLRPSRLFLYSKSKELRQIRLSLLRKKVQDNLCDISFVYENREEATSAMGETAEGFGEYYQRYIPIDDIAEKLMVSEASIDNRNVLICGEQATDLPGVKQFDIVPSIDSENGAYIVLDNTLRRDTWSKFLEIVLEKEPNLHIFDFFDILQPDRNDITCVTRKRVFKTLQKRYKRCIWCINSDEGIMRDAKENGIEVITLNINGEPAEYKEIKKKKADSLLRYFMMK